MKARTKARKQEGEVGAPEVGKTLVAICPLYFEPTYCCSVPNVFVRGCVSVFLPWCDFVKRAPWIDTPQKKATAAYLACEQSMGARERAPPTKRGGQRA